MTHRTPLSQNLFDMGVPITAKTFNPFTPRSSSFIGPVYSYNVHDPEGYEPTIPASERPQTHALDGAATGNGIYTL